MGGEGLGLRGGGGGGGVERYKKIVQVHSVQ